jgi:hypothetical protein
VKKLKYPNDYNQDIQVVESIQRNIDIITATLLLTGQLTIARLIVEPGGFALSVGGPLTGLPRLEGTFGNKTYNFVIDIGDIVLAILLITNEINVTGIFLGPGRFSINMTGPIFGIPKHEYTIPDLEKVFTQFRWVISDHLNVNPDWLLTK